jgi:hypothetical protein
MSSRKRLLLRVLFLANAVSLTTKLVQVSDDIAPQRVVLDDVQKAHLHNLINGSLPATG